MCLVFLSGLMISGTKFHIVSGNDPAIFHTRSKSVYMQALKDAGFADVTYEEIRFGDSLEAKRWSYQAIACRKPFKMETA